MSGLRSIIETPQTRRCMLLLLTAADEATEACLYRLLRERLARTTAFRVATGRRCARSTPATAWCSPTAAASLLSWKWPS